MDHGDTVKSQFNNIYTFAGKIIGDSLKISTSNKALSHKLGTTIFFVTNAIIDLWDKSAQLVGML